MKTGVILAAGLGTRLAGASPGTAKPLALVQGMELLLRTLHSHEKADRDRVVVVLGWEADRIRRFVEECYTGNCRVEFVFNPLFRLSNGISVLQAREHAPDNFLLTMADHILDDRIMAMVPENHPPPGGVSLFVDYKINSIFDLPDATKVQAEGERLVRLDKTLTDFNCVDTGVFLATPALMNAIDGVYKEKGDASLSEGVQRLADAGKARAIDIGDAYWQDVDTPEMLVNAEKLLKHDPS